MLSLMKKYKDEIDKCDLLIIELREEIEKLKKEKQTAIERLVSVLKKLDKINEEKKNLVINQQ